MAHGRKILYLIGAGASRAIGAHVSIQGGGRIGIPVQSEFWNVFLRLAGNTKARRRVESFLFRYFLGYHRAPARSSAEDRRRMLARIDVEEVFTFLSERSKAPSSSPQLKTYADRTWVDLVEHLSSVFARFAPDKFSRRLVRDFHTKHVRSRDAIVSFNYDTVFERSFPASVPWGYAGIEDCTGKLRILKPHGSINWQRTNGNVRRVSSASRPVIVAPTHLKFVQAPEAGSAGEEVRGYLDDVAQVREIWESMEKEMKAAKILVFIGYSFPVADLYFSSVLRTALSSRESAPAVAIVNPDAMAIATRLQSRFRIERLVKYFDFQQFIDAGRAGLQRAVDTPAA